jgi:hypothetical protein
VAIAYSALPNSVHTMLKTSIALCETLLRHNETFYPIAAVDLNGDIQAVMCDAFDDVSGHGALSATDAAATEPNETNHFDNTTTNVTSSIGMIERLAQRVNHRTEYVNNANSVIMYMAFIEAKHRVFTDVIVADVTLYAGATQQYYFPVTYLPGKAVIGPAFTMHTS